MDIESSEALVAEQAGGPVSTEEKTSGGLIYFILLVSVEVVDLL